MNILKFSIAIGFVTAGTAALGAHFFGACEAAILAGLTPPMCTVTLAAVKAL